MTDPKHPLWPIVRLAVAIGGLAALLKITAHNFDHTEVQTILFFGGFLGFVEGGVRRLRDYLSVIDRHSLRDRLED